MQTTTAGLNVGHIPYLNCVPWFHFLKPDYFGRLISGVPAELNRLLQQGEIDVSPSSSFEYARHFRDYLLLPGHSISSNGPVQSVLLFSPCELTELEGEQIAITGESATSINLLRVILREFVGLRQVTDNVPDRPVEQLIAAGVPALLIGDRALHLAAQKPAGVKIFDLGEIWQQQTGLPFVYALWMIRKDALEQHRAALQQLSVQLTDSCRKLLQQPQQIAILCAEQSHLTAGQIVDYWQQIDYRLEARHIEGMKLFFQLCVKQQLLEEMPAIEYFSYAETVTD